MKEKENKSLKSWHIPTASQLPCFVCVGALVYIYDGIITSLRNIVTVKYIYLYYCSHVRTMLEYARTVIFSNMMLVLKVI
jgi:hypothetical protein